MVSCSRAPSLLPTYLQRSGGFMFFCLTRIENQRTPVSMKVVRTVPTYRNNGLKWTLFLKQKLTLFSRTLCTPPACPTRRDFSLMGVFVVVNQLWRPPPFRPWMWWKRCRETSLVHPGIYVCMYVCMYAFLNLNRLK